MSYFSQGIRRYTVFGIAGGYFMRIVTRPDFDGIVCAVLLSDALDITTPVYWVEPNTMQHGQAQIEPGDIIANLSYHPSCKLWFDHHESNRIDEPFNGIFKIAPSAAALVYEYYQNQPGESFKRDYSRLIKETDKIDSAQLSVEEVLHPEKNHFQSLSMTILSHNREDEPYWNHLVQLLRTRSIEEVVEDPEVKTRITQALKINQDFISLLKKHTVTYSHITISDFRPLGYQPQGNRFLVFYLYPESIVNIRIRYDKEDLTKVRISIGHSIFNRQCNVNAGLLCSQFRGGGHRGAGACTVSAEKTPEVMSVMLEILSANLSFPFPILFDDPSVVAVEKPAGISCSDSFMNSIHTHLFKISQFTGTLYPIYSINRETSGIVIFAKDQKIHDQLRSESKNNRRIFVVLVHGNIDPNPESKSLPLIYFEDDSIPGLKDKWFYINDFYFQVMHESSRYSLLRVDPGSTDAPESRIREVFKNNGTPVVDDINAGKPVFPFHRSGIHCGFFAFNHPQTQNRIVLEASLPVPFLVFETTSEI